MNDPLAPRFRDDAGAPVEARPNPGMADTLQQALKSLAGATGSMAANGTLTPDALAAIARRAGLSDPAQIADLARMMGVAGGTATAEDVPQHIVFALGDVECAVSADVVQGVERITDIAAVPNTVPWVLGVIHLRGSILSVVDLARFLDLPSHPITQRSRLLVITQREMAIGMVVDAVTEMRDLRAELAQGSAGAGVPMWAAPYADQMITIDGRGVPVLNPERLLFAEKMHRYRADFT